MLNTFAPKRNATSAVWNHDDDTRHCDCVSLRFEDGNYIWIMVTSQQAKDSLWVLQSRENCGSHSSSEKLERVQFKVGYCFVGYSFMRFWSTLVLLYQLFKSLCDVINTRKEVICERMELFVISMQRGGERSRHFITESCPNSEDFNCEYWVSSN